MNEISRRRHPTIAITIGDAAGIGPEVAIKAAADEAIREQCRPVLIGDRSYLKHLAKKLGIGRGLSDFVDDVPTTPDAVEVYQAGELPREFVSGIDSAVTGKASAECIETAVELWKRGTVDAVATAPISKKAIGLGGFDYPGHTEFLAELTGTKNFAMSFFAEKLRVVLLSTHVSLRDAIELVERASLAKLIRFSNDRFSELLHRPVKLAVAGLNPHASEFGMFGEEEAQQITPAIEECRAAGIDVSGPYSPDTIFLRGYRGEFDAIIACYHDQATIAVKSLSFGASVNVTLGLPLIRTSVDHGTAFDIAGKGLAESSSMKAAVSLAAELARNRLAA